MKVVVVAQDSASTWMMVNALRDDHPGLSVILEKPVSRWRLLYSRLRKLGAWNVFGQILFMLSLPILKHASKSYLTTLIESSGYRPVRPTDLNAHEVVSVNSEKCMALLSDLDPDLVVVNGTRIISSKVLACCRAVFLNTHCGITPAYRGVHGAYWALYKNDAENVGVTVHLVNTGIDTGAIIYQQPIVVDDKDNFLSYPIKQYIAGIPLMKKAIKDIADSRLSTFSRDDLETSLWYHPTLWQYLVARLTRGIR